MPFINHSHFLLLLCFLISLLTATLGYWNKQKLDVIKGNWLETKADLTTAHSTLLQAKQNETDTQQELIKTRAKLEEVSTSLMFSQEELKKRVAHIAELTDQLATKEGEMTQLKEEVMAQELKIKELSSLPLENNSPGKREAELTAQVAEQKELVTQLKNQIEQAQNKIQEYVTKDTERKKLQIQLGIEGKIVAVNRTWNFVVLSIGNKNGVTNNTEMLVKRGQNLIGKIRVTSVEPSTSIADIISSTMSQGHLIQPGDSVIYENN